jgi:hypothetical protein
MAAPADGCNEMQVPRISNLTNVTLFCLTTEQPCSKLLFMGARFESHSILVYPEIFFIFLSLYSMEKTA